MLSLQDEEVYAEKVEMMIDPAQEPSPLEWSVGRHQGFFWSLECRERGEIRWWDEKRGFALNSQTLQMPGLYEAPFHIHLLLPHPHRDSSSSPEALQQLDCLQVHPSFPVKKGFKGCIPKLRDEDAVWTKCLSIALYSLSTSRRRRNVVNAISFSYSPP